MADNTSMIKFIRKIVCQILEEKGLLLGDWHVGTVTAINSPTTLTVKVNGSTTTQVVPCNPNEVFEVNDEVFVQFINGDSRNKFVPFRRGIGNARSNVISGGTAPSNPTDGLLWYNTTNNSMNYWNGSVWHSF